MQAVSELRHTILFFSLHAAINAQICDQGTAAEGVGVPRATHVTIGITNFLIRILQLTVLDEEAGLVAGIEVMLPLAGRARRVAVGVFVYRGIVYEECVVLRGERQRVPVAPVAQAEVGVIVIRREIGFVEVSLVVIRQSAKEPKSLRQWMLEIYPSAETGERVFLLYGTGRQGENCAPKYRYCHLIVGGGAVDVAVMADADFDKTVDAGALGCVDTLDGLEVAVDGRGNFRRDLLLADIFEFAFGGFSFLQIEVCAGNQGAGRRTVRYCREDPLQREHRLGVLTDRQRRRAENQVVFRVAGALRLERDKEVVSGLRITVIELLSGRDKKLVGGQSAQRNSRDERKKQREALHMPHGTSRSLSIYRQQHNLNHDF